MYYINTQLFVYQKKKEVETMRSLLKDAARGNHKIKRYPKYDLNAVELKELLNQATQNVNGAYQAICAAYDAGIKRCARMAQDMAIQKKQL